MLTSTVKLIACLQPSILVSQIVSTLLPMTYMGQESNQANRQSPMHTLLPLTLEHVQSRNGVPSRQNPLRHSPCPSHCPYLCPFPCLRPSLCPARTCPLSQHMYQGCTIPIIPIPLCPSPFIPILREPQWCPLIIPLTHFQLTHSHHKCSLDNL